MAGKFDGVEKFIRRIEQARRSGAKDIRLTAEEATDASVAVAALLARLIIVEEQLRLTLVVDDSQPRVDGGGLAR